MTNWFRRDGHFPGIERKLDFLLPELLQKPEPMPKPEPKPEPKPKPELKIIKCIRDLYAKNFQHKLMFESQNFSYLNELI